MKYNYKAKNSQGQIKEGVIDAADNDQAAKTLQTQKLFVLDLQPASAGDKKGGGPKIPFIGNRVSLKDKIIFTQQLAMMIKAGLPLVDAFNALEEQTENHYFSMVIGEIINDVKGGKALSEALGKYPKIFPKLYITIIKSGEKSGKLDEVLNRLSEQLQKDYELISKIKSALTYPILIIGALVGIVVLMLIFVIPQLKNIFRDMGVELPLVTRIILGVSDSMRTFWYIYLILIIGSYFGIKLLTRTKTGAIFWDRIMLKIPIIGNLIKKIYIARFTRTMGTLVASGLPMLDIISTVKDIISNRLYQKAFINIGKDVENGIQLSKSLKKQKIFPPMIYNLIAVGEQSGKLDYVLLSMADFFDKEVENTTNNLATLVEPILILIIGAGVGLVVAAVIMPIYSLVNVI